MHLPKKGLRALGIAESFSGRVYSTLAGIVMRKDLKIDGFAFSRVTIGGTDATDGVLAIVDTLKRRDINVILLSGCVIAFFNIIDPAEVRDRTGLPVICVTYEASSGLEGDILHHFPGDTARLDAYHRLGDRTPHILPDGQIMHSTAGASILWMRAGSARHLPSRERSRNPSGLHASAPVPPMVLSGTRIKNTSGEERPPVLPPQEISYLTRLMDKKELTRSPDDTTDDKTRPMGMS